MSNKQLQYQYQSAISLYTDLFSVSLKCDVISILSRLYFTAKINHSLFERTLYTILQCRGQVQYVYSSTYLSVLDVLNEYLVYGNAKVLVLVLVLDQKVLGTYK